MNLLSHHVLFTGCTCQIIFSFQGFSFSSTCFAEMACICMPTMCWLQAARNSKSNVSHLTTGIVTSHDWNQQRILRPRIAKFVSSKNNNWKFMFSCKHGHEGKCYVLVRLLILARIAMAMTKENSSESWPIGRQRNATRDGNLFHARAIFCCFMHTRGLPLLLLFSWLCTMCVRFVSTTQRTQS